jgi:hypothetical protein
VVGGLEIGVAIWGLEGDVVGGLKKDGVRLAKSSPLCSSPALLAVSFPLLLSYLGCEEKLRGDLIVGEG